MLKKKRKRKESEKKEIERREKDRCLRVIFGNKEKPLGSIIRCLIRFFKENRLQQDIIEQCTSWLTGDNFKGKHMVILFMLSAHKSIVSWAALGKCSHKKNHWKNIYPTPIDSLYSYLQGFHHLYFNLYTTDPDAVYESAVYLYKHRWHVKTGLNDPWGFDWEEKRQRSENILRDSGIFSLIGDPIPGPSFGFTYKSPPIEKEEEEEKDKIIITT